MAHKIIIHTDGSCIGNPGPGGWGVVLQAVNHDGQVIRKKEITGFRPNTTNNRMELRAAIAGLAALKNPNQAVELHTDSQYVFGILRGNKARANKKMVAALRKLAAKHHVTPIKVRGHAGNELNEHCDLLARGAAEDLNVLLSHKTRVLVGGSRGFKNYHFISRKLDHLLYRLEDILIISGGALGVDKGAEEYADINGYPKLILEAEWDIEGKPAGYNRNKEMGKLATHTILFWDGESKGTAHMIELCKKLGIPLRVIRI